MPANPSRCGATLPALSSPLQDRCPHRHAPLSKGRIEGEQLRDPAKADIDQIPETFGLTQTGFVAKASAIEYRADYQLINDNLTDLSHLDFVHEKL